MHIQLLITLFCLFSLAHASTHKTFLRRRTDVSNIGMQWATHTPALSEKNPDTSVTAAPFFRHSRNRTNLGNYFTGGMKNTITIATGGAARSANAERTTNVTNIYGHMIDHSPSYNVSTPATAAPLHGTVSLLPESWTLGTLLHATQPLHKIAKGLVLHVALPFLHEETELHAQFSETPSNIAATDGVKHTTLSQYFSGTLSKSAPRVTQSVLTRAQLKNSESSDTQTSQTGIGDVSLQLLYTAYNFKQWHITCGATAVIPTGNNVSNEYLFSPQLGNNEHVEWGLYAQITGRTECKNRAASLEGTLGIDWRYSRNGTERRILGVYAREEKQEVSFPHYRMMMHNGKPGVFPGANILEQKVSVTPHNQVQALGGLTAHYKQWHLQLGYTLYYRDAESVTLAHTHDWHNDLFAFADQEYRMDATYNDFHLNTIGGSGINSDAINSGKVIDDTTDVYSDVSMYGPIQIAREDTSSRVRRQIASSDPTANPNVADSTETLQSVYFNLSTAPCTTPSQTTHTLLVGITYSIQEKSPLSIGGGFSIERAHDQKTTPEHWHIWTHISAQF